MDLITQYLGTIAPEHDGSTELLADIPLPLRRFFFRSGIFFRWTADPLLPKYFRPSWQAYAKELCFMQNSYYVPAPFEGPSSAKSYNYGQNIVYTPVQSVKQAHTISYYQWVTFVLVGQALSFYAPIVIWRFLHGHNSLKLRTVMQVCEDATLMDEWTHRRCLKKAASFISMNKGTMNNWLGDRMLIISYLIVKCLFMVNALAQLALLKIFLGEKDIWWGLNVINSLWKGEEWQETGAFPRVTLCDFSIRANQNINHHTVQCLLTMNIFNEKIFIAEWGWFVLMVTLSVVSFFSWAMIFIFDSEGIVKKYLRAFEKDSVSPLEIKKFVAETLSPIGHFMLRLIGRAKPWRSGQMVKVMWSEFKERKDEEEELEAQEHNDSDSSDKVDNQ